MCMMKAHCCTFWPIPRKDRNLTRHSMGSLPSWKETETVLGATATLTVLQSSLSVFSIMSLIAVLMTSMPPGLETCTIMLDRFIQITQCLQPHLSAAQVPRLDHLPRLLHGGGECLRNGLTRARGRPRQLIQLGLHIEAGRPRHRHPLSPL